MKNENTKKRTKLILLFAAIIFAFMILAIVFGAVIGYVLVKLEVIELITDDDIFFFRLILLMSVTSLVMGAVGAFFASKISLKPVNKLITQINRLAEGDFKARLELEGSFANISAIKEITRSFNKMASELENTEMLRGDFINNFSHEFKTPIVSIAGFAKLIKKGNLTHDQSTEYLDIIEEESLRLANMATNVLNLTKIENQSILKDTAVYNLSEQIRGCVLTLEGKWQKKNITFQLDFHEFDIRGNKEMLQHVWLNIIDNAIKFSPENQKIEIDITQIENTLSVCVSNRGRTIDSDKIERIFNKFYQEDEAHATEGNGIGLALVKSAVKLHGGRVWAESEDGTTDFVVELPAVI